MAKVVEVDEEQLLRSEQLRQTVAEILKHPEGRRKLLEAQKLRFPDTPIPEIDTVQQSYSELEKLREDLATFKNEQKAAKEKEESDRNLYQLNHRWTNGQARLKKEGYTEEGLKAVEELMAKHGIVDHEIGRAYFERLNPPQPPVTPAGSSAWGFFDTPEQNGDDIKQLIESKGDNEPLLRKMVGDALAEVRGQSRR